VTAPPSPRQLRLDRRDLRGLAAGHAAALDEDADGLPAAWLGPTATGPARCRRVRSALELDVVDIIKIARMLEQAANVHQPQPQRRWSAGQSAPSATPQSSR